MLRENLKASTDTITIKIPPKYINHKLEVLVYPVDEIETKNIRRKGSKYDFSDLAGKMKWEGDSLAEQRKIRNEWK